MDYVPNRLTLIYLVFCVMMKKVVMVLIALDVRALRVKIVSQGLTFNLLWIYYVVPKVIIFLIIVSYLLFILSINFILLNYVLNFMLIVFLNNGLILILGPLATHFWLLNITIKVVFFLVSSFIRISFFNLLYIFQIHFLL